MEITARQLDEAIAFLEDQFTDELSTDTDLGLAALQELVHFRNVTAFQFVRDKLPELLGFVPRNNR